MAFYDSNVFLEIQNVEIPSVLSPDKCLEIM